MLHNMPIGADNVNVSIYVPIVLDAAIPFPFEDIASVADAVGTFIAWPKRLVRQSSEVWWQEQMRIFSLQINRISISWYSLIIWHTQGKEKHVAKPKIKGSLKTKESGTCRPISTTVRQDKLKLVSSFVSIVSDDKIWFAPMTINIMSYTHDLLLGKDDVGQFVRLEEIAAVCISLYMRWVN